MLCSAKNFFFASLGLNNFSHLDKIMDIFWKFHLKLHFFEPTPAMPPSLWIFTLFWLNCNFPLNFEKTHIFGSPTHNKTKYGQLRTSSFTCSSIKFYKYNIRTTYINLCTRDDVVIKAATMMIIVAVGGGDSQSAYWNLITASLSLHTIYEVYT